MKFKYQFKLKHFINYILVAVLIAVFIIIDLTSKNGLNTSTKDILTKIAYSIILAVSLNMVVGFLGELSLGHAGFMCVGAYIGCLCANIIRDSGVITSNVLILIVAMLIGGLAAAVCGFLIGIPTLRLKGDYLAIATLAFGEIVRTVIKNSAYFGGALGLKTVRYSDRTNPIPLYIIGFIVVFIALIVIQNIMRSKQGRAVQAIRDNEIAAKSVGVNVTYYKLMIFVIAAFFAGIAGVIYGHSVTPVRDGNFDFNYSIEILVMVVLGGMGNITGSILSAALLTFINYKLNNALSGDLAVLKNFIYALILILIVIYNNAPALRGIREKFNLYNLVIKIKSKFCKPEEGGNEPPTNASWDKIPTKIPMDAILSTDMTSSDKDYEESTSHEVRK